MNKILKLNAETLQLEEIKVNNNIVTCEELHNAIGGYFEHINFNENFIKNHIDIWVDEEGKLKDLKPSIALINQGNQIVDVLAGDVIFTSTDGLGNTLSLYDNQIKIIKEEIKYTCMLAIQNNNDSDPGLKKVRLLEGK